MVVEALLERHRLEVFDIGLAGDPSAVPASDLRCDAHREHHHLVTGDAAFFARQLHAPSPCHPGSIPERR